ncbi:MAG: hypothetical protein EOP02_18825 [Proteobacteria bacterium]|nr:MAG: hypothetical protein EOP02_18825 [Pseudomonadota bacterium]
MPVPFGCSKSCSRPAAVTLAAVSSELMHGACQNAVPGFWRVDREDPDSAEAVSSAWVEGFKSLD